MTPQPTNKPDPQPKDEAPAADDALAKEAFVERMEQLEEEVRAPVLDFPTRALNTCRRIQDLTDNPKLVADTDQARNAKAVIALELAHLETLLEVIWRDQARSFDPSPSLGDFVKAAKETR